MVQTADTAKRRGKQDEPSSSHILPKEKKRKSSLDPSVSRHRRTNTQPNKKQQQHQQLQSDDSTLQASRRSLPVYAFKDEIIQTLLERDVLLVVAETGSGKSTQIPAYLDESGHFTGPPQHRATPASNHQRKQQQYSSSLDHRICVTQPRRVAAMTVAKRVAEEQGCEMGTHVGYRVRFDDCTHPDSTTILYVTDGMLLREAMSDSLLSRYRIVILDEAHERSLQTDILFGVVKRAMRARKKDEPTSSSSSALNKDHQQQPSHSNAEERIEARMRSRAQKLRLSPLKVVVMSATLDVATFQDFFPQATSLKIPGRLHPVQMVYTKEPQEDYMDAALSTVLQIHHADNDNEKDGDILVFLPGQEEIDDLTMLLKRHLQQEETLRDSLTTSSKNVDVVQNIKGIGTDLTGKTAAMVHGVFICPLYAALPSDAQLLAFCPKPPGCSRKIVLATNIAETSVTLDGIRYVVDCGKHKMRDYNGTTGMERLTVQDVSQAQAAQRSGRAGRVSAGVCVRLYREVDFEALAATSVPEIQRVNLAQVVLVLKGMGVHNPSHFDYLTVPNPQSLKKACELLYALEALDDDLQLTDHGKKMARLPLDPTYAHLLLQSTTYSCVSEILTAVSMMSAENVLFRPGGFSGGDSEMSTSNTLALRATQAHRRFASYEGDIPTLLKIYQAWRKEALFVPNTSKKAQKKLQQEGKGGGRILHGDWCTRNFVSGRALVRAHDVRRQLSQVCGRTVEQNGLGMDIQSSCGKDNMEVFFKCVCAGLFLQAASRVANANSKGKGNGGRGSGDVLLSTRGRYKTKVGNSEVSVHPTSTLFGRNPAPKCVVYTELLVTKKTYIRGVTQVREEWLAEVAPKFFKS